MFVDTTPQAGHNTALQWEAPEQKAAAEAKAAAEGAPTGASPRTVAMRGGVWPASDSYFETPKELNKSPNMKTVATGKLKTTVRAS